MLAQLTRTAVYGPVRTVVWQGSAGDRGPYADQTGFEDIGGAQHSAASHFLEEDFWTIHGKADSPIGCCSGLLTIWRFHNSYPRRSFYASRIQTES